jgi:hypothetical protein
MESVRRALVSAMSSLRQYWIVATFATVCILGTVVFFVVWQSVRDGFMPNVAAELLGIGASALVTVFVVERAIALAEDRRWRPLTETILWRVRAHSMHSITVLAAKCNPNIAQATEKSDREGRRTRLNHGIQQPECFSHLEDEDRRTLYQQISRTAGVLEGELSHHQMVFSRHPDLYRGIVKVERETLAWSAYRDADLRPGVTGQEENPMICQVACAFLALESELEKIPPGE